ncbi:MAG: sugar phosphate isomerase/epimerase family protein [Tepidisphaerales bacterium]
MKLALNRGTTGGGLPLPEFVRLASESGFPAADFDPGFGSPEQLRDLFGSFGVDFGGWGVPEWRKDESEWRQNLIKLDGMARTAAAIKADHGATWILPSSDLPFMETWRFHVTRLSEVAKVLAGHGLRLGLEFVAPYHLRVMKPHEFVFTPGLMLELAAEVGSNVGLLVDCFHLHCAGVPMSFLSRVPAGKIVLAHVNDAPRLPLTDIADGNRLLPGEGAIDQAGFRSALQAAGYDGPVSLEVFSRLKNVPPAEAARTAAAACRAAGWL